MGKHKGDAKIGDQGTLEYNNRKAFHTYEITERLEVGIALTGAEVKSLRNGGGDLQDAFAKIEKGELVLHGMKISPYEYDMVRLAAPRRPRKLLAHKREILKLRQRTVEKGYTIVPLRGYFKEGNFKLELGVAKGRRAYQRKDAIADREAAREIDRAKKSRDRGDD